MVEMKKAPKITHISQLTTTAGFVDFKGEKAEIE
jgi:hypothetical protein